MALRELAERRGDGFVVQLWWDDEGAPGSDVVVLCHDERRHVFQAVYPPRARALDAFYHPNAYPQRAAPAAHPRRRRLRSSSDS